MKKFVIVLGVLVVILGGGYLALSAVISPERIKNTLLPTISDALGRDVRIDGGISITLFPTFGLTFQNLVVANPPTQAKGNMLEVEEATLAVAVLPLLKKELVVREFILKNPKLSLIKMANGEVNWALGGAPLPEPQAAATPAAAAGTLPLSDVRIGTIAVKGGHINYHDRTTGSKASLEQANFEMTMPMLNETANITGSALLNGQKVKGKIKLSTPYGLLHGEVATLKLDASSPFADIIAEANITYTTTTPRPVVEVILTQVSLARDGLSTSGKGDVRVLLGSTRPEVTANLALSFMEIGTAGAPAAETTPTTAEPIVWPDTALDFSGLNAADVDAKLKIDQIKAHGRMYGPFVAGVSLVNGRLEGNIHRFGIFDGTVKANAVVNARTSPATASFHTTLEAAQLAQTLPEKAGIYGATGTFDGKTALTTKGKSIKQFVENLNGTVDFSISHMGATKLDLEAVTSRHLGGLGAIVAQSISPETIEAVKQKVTGAAFSTYFTNGRGQVVVQFSGPVLAQGGEGIMNLPAADISLRMNPLLKASRTRDIVLPFYIEEALNAPAFKPDQEGITREVARQAARIGAEKLIGKALQKNGVASNILGAFGSVLNTATNKQDQPADKTTPTPDGSTPPPPPNPVKDLKKAFGGLLGK